MEKLNTALRLIASRSEDVGVSFENLSKALSKFIEIQSKRLHKNPLKAKQIIKILKQSKS